jgi:hypothetical protein
VLDHVFARTHNPEHVAEWFRRLDLHTIVDPDVWAQLMAAMHNFRFLVVSRTADGPRLSWYNARDDPV